jgi:hypothetical protein
MKGFGNFDVASMLCNFHEEVNNLFVRSLKRRRPSHFAVDEKHIKKLLLHLSKQPHYMNRNQRSGGKYIEKWRLFVPLSIINRTWEEPDVENI